MDIGSLSLLVIFGLLSLIAIGVPLGFASGAMAAVIIFVNVGEHAMGILLARYYSLVVTYSFLSVPLFIFMASLLERSNIARDLYDALNAWLRKTRGGVGVVTAIMATIMAAMSGIIGGEIVLLGLIALPQMLRLKYDQDMSIGIICASGSLGTMIPPSIVLIIYGLTTQTSITMLFQEAIVPGLMISGLIITYILVRTRLQPHLAPLSDEHWKALLPMLGYPELINTPLYASIASRMTNMDQVMTVLREPRNDIGVKKAMEILIAADVPCSPCTKRDDLESVDQIKAIGALETYVTKTMGELTVTTPPILFEGKKTSQAQPSPLLGEHSKEILQELGWKQSFIDSLIESGDLLVTKL